MKSKSLIAIAAVVASFSASAGELDGKGIKCVLVDWIDPILVSFQDGVATHFVLSMRDTKVNNRILLEKMNSMEGVSEMISHSEKEIHSEETPQEVDSWGRLID